MERYSVFSHVAIFTILSFAIPANAGGQDLVYAKSITDKLCSPQMHGRGYVKHGDVRAATFIRHEYQRIGIAALSIDYFQPFTISANSFPGAMKLEINGKALLPGTDYLIDPSSGGGKGIFDACNISVKALAGDDADSRLMSAAGKVLVIDSRACTKLSDTDKARVAIFRKRLLMENYGSVKAVIEVTGEKLSYGISTVEGKIPYFRVNTAACPDSVIKVGINIRNKYLSQYETCNVAGVIPGSLCTDSMLVFSAHYDHLGTMGRRTYFPGANDNASGVAALLALAEYFKANPPRYSIVFLAFSGEELGLLGSGYFADNPLVNMSKIKFLINLDLVGNGDDGITVVNGSVYPEFYNTLVNINDTLKLLPAIKKRGEACNSDHCPFYNKGVPCFFIYAIGGSPAYHDLDDRPESLSYKGFKGLITLLNEFVKRIH